MSVKLIFESLKRINEESLTPEQKIDMWYSGERIINPKTISNISKLKKYIEIATNKGYDNLVDALKARLKKLEPKKSSTSKYSGEVYIEPSGGENAGDFKIDEDKFQIRLKELADLLNRVVPANIKKITGEFDVSNFWWENDVNYPSEIYVQLDTNLDEDDDGEVMYWFSNNLEEYAKQIFPGSNLYEYEDGGWSFWVTSKPFLS